MLTIDTDIDDIVNENCFVLANRIKNKKKHLHQINVNIIIIRGKL